MVRRASYRMPSCTNHLESTHGHMNGSIPRRNAFWPSLHRICDNIMKKLQNFDSYYKQYYSNYKRKFISKCQNKSVDIMRKLIINYKTDFNTQTCQCGESILIYSMIPESNRISKPFYFPIDVYFPLFYTVN